MSDFPKFPHANITLTPEQEAEMPMWADENGRSLLPHNKGEQVVTIIKNKEAQP